VPVPTYQYACTSCAEQVEKVQRFTDDPLTVCPACGGSLRKVFSPVGIVFKGSGFYRTDSRKVNTAVEDPGTKTSKSNGSSGSGEGGGSDSGKPSADSKSAADSKGSSGGKSSPEGKKSGDAKPSPAGAGSSA
jgi:putative FmdB family regulatory protein